MRTRTFSATQRSQAGNSHAEAKARNGINHQDTKGEGMNPTFPAIPKSADEVAHVIVDAALKVHQTLGPGLLESIYETCLCHELSNRGVLFARQMPIAIKYGDIEIEGGLGLDLLVEDLVIVELKAVETMNALFEAQLLTYLKLTGKRLGLLINFNTPLLKHGLKRMAL
jgi:GxxExxY protein